MSAMLLMLATASHAESLCSPQERVVLACPAGKKLVSLCASGDLRREEGRLVYRFGRDRAHVELEHGALAMPAASAFAYDYQPWAKGVSNTVAFKRGDFRYFITHSNGAYGVEGGANFTTLRVMRGKEPVATLQCSEPRTTDRLYEELHTLGLPASDAL